MNDKKIFLSRMNVMLAIAISLIFILSSSALVLNPTQNNSNLSGPATIVANYNVTFTETGLSSGTQWNVTLNNVSEISTTSVISFSMANGTYAYIIGNVTGFKATPSSGNVIVSGSSINKTISFNSTSSASLSPVDLGTAANFTILAETTVTNTGTTSITGNVGLSPAAASYYTGFSESLSPSGQFSTSPYVTGDMYAADYASPTPAMLTTAVGDMKTAYTNAQGRTDPGYINLGAGNINGLTLAPGLYKWSTGLDMSTSVTLKGNASSVWIFQIAGTLTIGNSAKVILSGGALPQNVFWSVASGVSLGTGAQFYGNILSQTAITIATGASLVGRALAQTEVTLQGNNIKVPSPPVPVAKYNVTFNETGLSPGTSWSATFNGTTLSSTNSTISFMAVNGTYPYNITSISGYTVSPSSGNISVVGKNVTQNITFTPIKVVSKYTVTFNETGLSPGTSWSATFNGTTLSSTTSSISFMAVNGTYLYSISSVSGYTLSISLGHVTVNGKNVSQDITFT
ncbi:MAG: ice-binding family protein, partial [Cuniculiplasma sp.]